MMLSGRVSSLASILTRRTFCMDAKWLAADGAAIHSTDCRAGKVAHDPAATNLVVYHADCPDGFAAAFAAWKLLGDGAEYVAAQHGPASPHDLDVRGKHVVVVDYCFPAAVTQRMIAEAASFLILDHHASAEGELSGVDNRYKVFEMKQSGATLSWNYFHGADVPPLFRYIEDKDIWRWALKSSRAFTAGFNVPHDFKAWDEVLLGGEASINRIIESGSSILSYKDSVVQSHVKRAVPCTLKAVPHFKGMLVNTSTLASEIGNVLAETPGVDYGFLWFYDHKLPGFVCSLRSASDEVDVAAIAKAHGGGGHKRAAGFTLANAPLDSIFTDIKTSFK